MNFKKISTLFLTLFPLVACTVKSISIKEVKGDYFSFDSVTYNETIGPKRNDDVLNYDELLVRKLDKPLKDDFVYGVDSSTIKMVLSHGGVYYNKLGEEQDYFEILRDAGVNFLRLRVWNDPYSLDNHPYGAGTNDIKNDLEIAKMAKRVGMNILLDFHYSDFWADPGKQKLPKAWVNSKNLEQSLYDFTYNSLKYFKDNNVRVDAVQIGNEIHRGLLWPYAKLDYSNYDYSLEKISGLLKSGIKASKDVFNNIKTIIHSANVEHNHEFIHFYQTLINFGVNFDIVGVSYYPYWHGSLDNLSKTLLETNKELNKPVMIVEAASAFTLEDHEYSHNIFGQNEEEVGGYEATYQGQANYLSDLVNILNNIPHNQGLGVFYWEPGWLPINGCDSGNLYSEIYETDNYDLTSPKYDYSNGWANQALFNFNGRVLPSLYTLNMLKENNKERL